MERFERWSNRFEQVDGIRGVGAMCAFEIVKDKGSKHPDKELVGEIVKEATNRGLLLLSAGLFGNVIRLLMPLTITDAQLVEGLQILEESLEAVLTPQFTLSEVKK